jgi:hypothetical protein
MSFICPAIFENVITNAFQKIAESFAPNTGILCLGGYMTSIESQFDILSNFYLTYKNDNHLKEFMDFNDIGLPLAFLVSERLCEPTELALIYVQETFNMLLAVMGIQDIGFNSLDHLLATAEKAGS